ncbi:unnamed protein product [Parnassius apollo]|uniref:(apollo) hypothetical protein n=1 Tax=Parnassius apollo TaxID=110799 RepID=A0A8S3XTN2_PARAO|nr:unnamed protein product [Parnassius apollo]
MVIKCIVRGCKSEWHPGCNISFTEVNKENQPSDLSDMVQGDEDSNILIKSNEKYATSAASKRTWETMLDVPSCSHVTDKSTSPIQIYCADKSVQARIKSSREEELMIRVCKQGLNHHEKKSL